ncbi:hypothetical protein BG004_008495 [Podila humilis]|nr:hypothetical protein BG004_008495 [Podila humilis]
MHVENKVAIITGGASGLGKALAERLVSQGKDTKVAHFVKCDVTDFDQIGALFTAADDQFGGVDIMVNNAGIAEHGCMLLTNNAYSPNAGNWPRLIAINFTAVIEGTRLAIEYFRKLGKGGVVVNTSSITGVMPMPEWNTPVYAAAKFGVCGFTRSFKGFEKRESDKGIRVNCVAPAPVMTPIFAPVAESVKYFTMVSIDLVIDGFMKVIEDENCSGDVARITPEDGLVIMLPEHFI